MAPAATPSPVSAARPPLGAEDLDVDAVLARLAERFSCRDYDGTPIDPAVVDAIIRDGTEAPSSCNQQQWHFVVVSEPRLKDRACAISGGNHHFSHCAVIIYLCFQKGWTHDKFSIVQSVAGACYHMMLSAHLRGYACIWNAGIGDTRRIAAMLGIPPIFEIQGALAIGLPKRTAPAMKAPRRPFESIRSWNRFERPPVTLYPAKPAFEYPFFRIRNARNPYAVWDPRAWGWDRLADFRGYAVWAKSPLAGVYVSRRQGDAMGVEIGLLPELGSGARLLEVMPWGGTTTVELRRRFGAAVHLHVAELSAHNHAFIAERVRQEGHSTENLHADLFARGELPYPDGQLDAAFLPQVLEHTPEPERLLDEVRRVLRPGGTVVVSARNPLSRYGWYHYRHQSREQVPNMGPFRPIPSLRVRRLLAARFRIAEEMGIGKQANHDAATATGAQRFFCRLYAARGVKT